MAKGFISRAPRRARRQVRSVRKWA
jgi:hypothetical protein